jgi:phosphopentomutase
LKRAIIIVLDGVGIGAAPDADEYGDSGSNTLGNLARACGGLSLPRLERFGLGNIRSLEGVARRGDAAGAWGSMKPASAGKDSTAGHWEIAGVHLDKPFPTFPDGFPSHIIERFARETGRGVIGNVVGSGTDVINRFAAEQRESGNWIVYTSADSVFQIAADEQVIPLEQLYRACTIARAML